MIARYTGKEMGKIFSPDSRFHYMLKVETAVALSQAELKIIPQDAADDIVKYGKFSLARIEKIEAKTKHDVIAFVSNVAENVGENGRYVHYGLTSSDVLDTALSLQMRDAYRVLKSSVVKLRKNLKSQIQDNKRVVCSGRTHGIHAEPTTFGFKLAGFYAELSRNQFRLERAIRQMSVVKLSGAVGTYSSLSPEVERLVGEKLELSPETLATQVIPRDRHAEVLSALALLGAGLERLAVELRHLQRTEVGEVEEGFSKGQKGSSAMPHKKNPISGENISGLARLLRSYAGAAQENIALWHERDISHSSVERVIIPDAFIVADYAVQRMAELVGNLIVKKDRMAANMQMSRGMLYSSHLLLALVKKGLSREDAYARVQKLSHSLKPNENLADKAKKDKDIRKLMKVGEVDKVFSGQAHLKEIEKQIDKVLKD